MPRDTLTRERIISAAIELLDTDGLEGLSMRSLGERLGSAPTAVYWHVKNKDDLVTLVSERAWGEIELPDLDGLEWREAATLMSRELFSMLVRHPWVVQALSSYLMPGPGKARYDDYGLAVFEKAGFVGGHAAAAVAPRRIECRRGDPAGIELSAQGCPGFLTTTIADSDVRGFRLLRGP
jgi:AcrR family transcriptional regulator